MFHYIPINDVLETVVSRKDAFDIIKANLHSSHDDDVLFDCCDGSWLNKSDNEATFTQLHLYLDELELCNPIGAKQGKHKLTAVYFTIGNRPV